LKTKLVGALLAVIFIAIPIEAQEAETFSVDVGNRYRIRPDVVYDVSNGHQNKLDVIYPRAATEPVPTVVYIHGGGWVGGDKAGAVLQVLPYLEMGWAAVNVEYRLARVSKAPGAVEDCRCALLWVVRNAKEYHIDPSRLVVTGHSAGGHLSLTTGMLKVSDGLDNNCPLNDNESEPRVAAVVNWFGITDVGDLLDGPNRKTYAVAWLGSLPDKLAIAKRVSPLTYVRKDNPPIITIHGDADNIVPYSHAVRLHRALDQAGVSNQLDTVAGGGHGGFSDGDNRKAYSAIRQFLAKHNLGPVK